MVRPPAGRVFSSDVDPDNILERGDNLGSSLFPRMTEI